MIEEVRKLEIVLEKEIANYKTILDYEEKKVASILANRLQDIELHCAYQMKQMKKAKELADLRERQVDEVAKHLCPLLIGRVTVKDLIAKLPVRESVRLASLRIELNGLMQLLQSKNKAVPKLLEQGLVIYKQTRDILSKIKKIGYNSKGKEQSVNQKMALLVNARV